ncbi:MAG: M20/M25/M40 family metallo-hydrolase [Acidobacteriota bacterium]
MKRLLILICLFATPVFAQSQAEIVELIEQPAISGNESQLVKLIQTRLPQWAREKARVDNLGNLVITIGTDSPTRLLAAPMDEPGYVVSEIRADGFIRVQFVPGIAPTPLYHQFHEGQPIFIVTEKGNVLGVTATLSTHLQRNRTVDDSQRITGLDELWIDIGAHSQKEVEAAGVRLLDPISLQMRAEKLGTHQVAGVSAATRAGLAALIAMVNAISPESIEGTLTIAFVAQDIFGRKGIDRLSKQIKADEVILITDTWLGTLAVGQNVERDALGRVGKLGNGPLIADENIWGKGGSWQNVSALKPRAAIYTGGPKFNNAKMHTLALPVLFGGTTTEVVDQRDVERLTKQLIEKVAKSPTSPTKATAAPVKDRTPVKADPSPLAPLIETYGVAGFEQPVAEAIKKLLPSWAKPTTDTRGNLILTVGQGKNHLVFAAHMDEIGYVINAINEDGSANVQKRGGFFDTLFEAHPMLVHTANGSVTCVISPRRNYSRAERRNVSVQDFSLYFGTASRAETMALGVKIGDSVTMRKKFSRLQQGRAHGRSFDDRVGSAALIMALQKLTPARLKNRVTFVWTVEEEVGLEGAKVVADRIGTDVNMVFAIDTFVSSDSPLESTRFANAQIGAGAVVRAMDNSNIVPREILNNILKLARLRKIPIQYGATGGGNDGAVFTQYGAIDVPLSWPLRYSHSPAEIIDLRDLDSLAELVRAIAEQLEP